MKKFSFLFLLFFFGVLNAQDSYHLDLISFLQNDYNLEAPSFVLENTESANENLMYVYGATSITTNSVTDFDFTRQTSFKISSAGNNAWDSGAGFKNLKSINKDDVLLLSFWAKKSSSESEVFIFVEDGITYDKEFYQGLGFSPDWNQYFIAVKASKNYGIDKMALGFHLAATPQEFEMGGFTALNFGQIDIEDVPSTFSTGAYEGIEADAEWRSRASDRIETLRKANLNVIVKDLNGNPIEDTEVKIEMIQHEFGFGSALVTCRFPNNDCYDATYVEKLQNLDGEGHGFNVAVTENALKWDGWEEEWLGSPDETAAAVQFLADNGIKMRGHTLFWPGYSLMPDDIVQNKNDLNYLRNRISGRIDEMINHPILSNLIDEWDVLNEITTNRDLEASFKNDPNFETGREIYQEIIGNVRSQDPNVKLYINDYIVLSGGGSGSNVVNRYKDYLDEIHESENDFDGIGFQCHIGSTPTSILKLESVFDEFYERYGKVQKVTEYDISDLLDEDTQAAYMRDILTMTFSHPSMEAFIMWGFWDNNHWKGNSPMFDSNWNLKPSGQAFIEKVFQEWWTNETKISDSNGQVEVRGFKGKYKVTVTKNDEVQEKTFDLTSDNEVEIILENTTTTKDFTENELRIVPNIVANKTFSIIGKSNINLNIEIINADGKVVSILKNKKSNQEINIDLPSGLYFLRIKSGEKTNTRKIIFK